jgi:hypothetical protein
VESLLITPDGNIEEREHVPSNSTAREKSFLQRVGRSLKNLFVCVNRPRSEIDVDGAQICSNPSSTKKHEAEESIPMQQIAHSWITQATVSFTSPFTVHQSLVIDLPPPLPHVLSSLQ